MKNYLLRFLILIIVLTVIYAININNTNTPALYPLIIYISIVIFYTILEIKTSSKSNNGIIYHKWTRYLLFYLWSSLLLFSIINYYLINTFNNIIMISGLLLTIFGSFVRNLSKFTLGLYFKENIEIIDKNQLCDKGIYKIIRHPGYLGNIIQSIGFPLILNSYFSLIISIIFIFVVIERMNYEENILKKEIVGYDKYILKTKKIIPLLY